MRTLVINKILEAKELYDDFVQSNILSMFADPIGPFGSPEGYLAYTVKRLELNSRIYSTNEEKNEFFIRLSDNLLHQIKTALGGISRDILYLYVYGLLVYNRHLGIIVVQPKDAFILNPDSDPLVELIINIRAREDEFIGKIEQFLATEEDALELLIKIIYTSAAEQISDSTIDKDKLCKIIFLCHTLILTIATRHDLTAGINRSVHIIVDKDGFISIPEQSTVMWGEIDPANYQNSVMGMQEFKEMSKLVNPQLKKKVGFDFTDAERLQAFITKNFNQTALVFSADSLKRELIHWGIGEERVEKLIEYFTFTPYASGIEVNKIYEYLKAKNNPMFTRAAFISHGSYLVCYPEQAFYATCFFTAFVFKKPKDFCQDHKIVDKISNNFCRVIGQLLMDEFKGSQVVLNLSLSKMKISNREIDVLFILNDRIYIIECKRLGSAEDNFSTASEYKQLTTNDMKQLKKEIKDFIDLQGIVLKYLLEKQNVKLDPEAKYIVKGLIVTKEFNPSHLVSGLPICHADKLVEYLRTDMSI